MHIQTIQTPHPKREQWPGEASETIYDNLRHAGLVDFAGNQEASTEQRLLMAAYAQQAVRRALRYEPDVPFADLEHSQTTTCVGYTILGSEALETLQVPHWVGFMNGHGFLLVPADDRLMLFDMLRPDLNRDITAALTACDVEKLTEQMGTTEHTATWVKTTKLVNHDRGSRSPEDYAFWYAIGKKSRRLGSQFSGDSERSISQHSLIISIYQPRAGRDIVRRYGAYEDARVSEDDVAMARALEDMAGRFPDVDVRSKHMEQVTQLVKRLSAAGEYESARKATESYFSSFYMSHDPRIAEKHGDCLRVIARAAANPMLASLAIGAYSRAVQSSRWASCVQGKVKATEKLVNDMS